MNESLRRLSAVFFADIVGFTEVTSRDEAAAMRLIAALQRVSYKVVEKTYKGRVVKFIGDAALAEFYSVDAAVRAALALQAEFAAAARPLGGSGQLRIAVHLGEVIASPDGDIYGDGVNTASRLQTQAQPGHVLVSEDVWRQLRARRFFQFSPLGELELKGISTRVAVFDVVASSEADTEIDFQAEDALRSTSRILTTRWRRMQRPTLGVALGTLVLLVGGMFVVPGRNDAVDPPAARPPLIAVLSPELGNAQPGHKDFAKGLAEAIQGELGASSDIMVATSAITAAYQGRRDAFHALARDVGITAVLQSTTRWSGERLRMFASLVEIPSGHVLWSRTFDRTVSDDFDVQNELADSVARAVEQRLAPPAQVERVTRNDTDVAKASPDATPTKKASATVPDRPVKKPVLETAARSEQPKVDPEHMKAELPSTLQEFAGGIARGDQKGLRPAEIAGNATAEIASLQIRKLDPAATVVNLVIVFRSGEPPVSVPVPYRAHLAYQPKGWRVLSFTRR